MTEIAPEGQPAPVEPEQSWMGPSQTEWEEAQERLRQYDEMVHQQFQAAQAQQAQPQGPPIPDPFADNYAEQFQAYQEHQLAPYRQFQEQAAMQQAQQNAYAILDKLADQGGDFDRDTAWARANQLINQFPGDPRGPQKALEQAARDQREFERRVGEMYHQRQIEQVQQAGNARPGIPAGVAGSQTIPMGGLGNVPNAVTQKFFPGG